MRFYSFFASHPHYLYIFIFIFIYFIDEKEKKKAFFFFVYFYRVAVTLIRIPTTPPITIRVEAKGMSVDNGRDAI